MPRPLSDRRFRTPYWPVAFAVNRAGHWRVILLTLTGNNCIELNLYEPCTHASLGWRTCSAKTQESGLEQIRDTLIHTPPSSSESPADPVGWCTTPIKPIAERCRRERGTHFHAQFFTVSDAGELCIDSFRGDGVELMTHQSFRCVYNWLHDLVLDEAAPVADPRAPRDLIGLQRRTGHISPQLPCHDLTRLFPADVGPLGVSTRVPTNGWLTF